MINQNAPKSTKPKLQGLENRGCSNLDGEKKERGKFGSYQVKKHQAKKLSKNNFLFYMLISRLNFETQTYIYKLKGKFSSTVGRIRNP